MEIDSHDFVKSALSALIDALHPFVTKRFAEVAPEVSEWTSVIERKDRQAGRFTERYNPRDVGLLLRALTENFGAIGYPFNGLLSRQASNCASELRGVRNRWAHNEEFSLAETYRALDSAEILIRAVGADAQAEEIAPLKAQVIAAMGTPTELESVADAPGASGSTMKHEPSTPAETLVELPGVRAQISARTLPVLSYALAHNAVPVVDEVVIDYDGPEMRGASVEVAVTCALGPLGDPKVVIADFDGAAVTTLRNADLRVDPARMLAVDTPMPGLITVILRAPDGATVATYEARVDVLSANQWVARPQQLALELLASFVQPNSTAIATLLRESSDRLRERTGNPSLDGYQQGSPERVDAIVGSIYDAIQARDVRYAEPPASWGLRGQKVRTPEEVLEGGLGTCMDTTVTLAAALEEAGINSTLWVVDGHIFLGYWRSLASLDAPAELDASSAINFVGLGTLALVETTSLTLGEDFATARRRPHNEHLSQDASSVLGVVDVLQARLSRIYPLPSRRVGPDGEVTVQEYRVAATPDALAYSPSAEALAGTAGKSTPARVGRWKNALLDLSLRNRLIHYGEKSGYSLAIPQPSLPLLEDLVSDGSAITLVPSDAIPTIERERGIRFGRDIPESTRATILAERKQAFLDVTEATYTNRLRGLAYKARTIVEETGANNLYLAFGMLRWTFNDRELRSPLVLVPVTLESTARGQRYRVALDEAGESTPNYCLLEKLRVTFDLQIPGLANPAKDDSGIDLPAAFAATRQALAAARLPFTVEDTVDLAILQFAKYRLWRDLDENWGEFTANPLVKHLIESPTEPFDDPVAPQPSIDLDALGTGVPVPADSTQLEAVAEAVGNRTFVLEGPPRGQGSRRRSRICWLMRSPMGSAYFSSRRSVRPSTSSSSDWSPSAWGRSRSTSTTRAPARTPSAPRSRPPWTRRRDPMELR